MKKLSFVIALLLVTLMVGCSEDSNPAAPDNQNSLEKYDVSIVGRVLDVSGNPVVGAVAALKKYDVEVRTNSIGEYHLKVEKLASETRSEAISDEVEITKDGQLITVFDIESYIDTVDDIFIEQRAVTCGISVDDFVADSCVVSLYEKINGVMTFIKSAEIGYNSSTNEASGFIYFVNTGQKSEYQVVVSCFEEGIIGGTSEVVSFTNLLGDISVPGISVTSPISSVYGAETLYVHSSRTIISYSWEIGENTYSGKDLPVTGKVLEDIVLDEDLEGILTVVCDTGEIATEKYSFTKKIQFSDIRLDNFPLIMRTLKPVSNSENIISTFDYEKIELTSTFNTMNSEGIIFKQPIESSYDTLSMSITYRSNDSLEVTLSSDEADYMGVVPLPISTILPPSSELNKVILDNRSLKNFDVTIKPVASAINPVIMTVSEMKFGRYIE